MGVLRLRVAGFVCTVAAAVGLSLSVCAAQTPVIVGFDPNFPPYQSLSSDGTAVGAHVDLLARISEMAGLQIEYLPLESGYACRNALQNGEVDIVLGSVYGGNIQPRLFSESQPISQSQLCMFAPRARTRALFSSNVPITAAYQAGTVTPSFLSAFQTIRCIALSNQIEVIDSVIEQRADVMIGVKSSIEYQLKARQLEETYGVANNYMLPIEFCMLVRSEDQRLLRSLNSALYELRISGEYETIMNTWVADESQRWHDVLIRILQVVAILGTTGLCLVLFNVRLNMLLKRQVAEKTGELAQKNRELEEQIEQTRKSNELQRYIVHSSPNAIVVFGADLRITLFNENARMLLHAPQMQIGSSITEIPVIMRLIGERIDQFDVPGLPSPLWEESFETEDGSKVTYRVGLYQLFSTQRSGKVVRGVSLSVRDITQERQMRERENEREKNLALNRLIAGIAHEIRNPLTAIKAYTMMLPHKVGNPEFQAQMARYVPMEVDRVNTLITNLIDYAKPRTAFREEMLVDEAADSCIILVSPLLRGKEIELHTELAPDLRIFCDRSQFKQVLINLFFNAIEATEEKARQQGPPEQPSPLFLKCWAEGNTCRLSLEDRGIGMTPEELAHATEAFFTTKERGSGLGLAISRQYVLDNGGEMEIISEKGEFTRITLIFERYIP